MQTLDDWLRNNSQGLMMGKRIELTKDLIVIKDRREVQWNYLEHGNIEEQRKLPYTYKVEKE